MVAAGSRWRSSPSSTPTTPTVSGPCAGWRSDCWEGFDRWGAPRALDRAQQAAVDRDNRARDVGGALGAEESDQVAVLVGMAEAAGRDFAFRRFFRGLQRAGVGRQPFGSEAACCDGVDGDPVAGNLPGERLEEPDRS